MIRYNKEKMCCNVPYSVNISVTERCPLRCPFCFQEYDHFHELDFQMVCDYINELSSIGTAQVQFSGGEPLVYPYLLDSIAYAHLKGLYTTISSSGFGMTEEFAEKLKIAGLDNCHISLNGSTEEIHALTRDGFKCAIQALKNLSKVELQTAINWVAYHENINDLPQLVALAKSFNVKHINVLSMKKNNADAISNRMNKKDFMDLVYFCNKYRGYLIVDSCFKELDDVLKGNKCLAGGCRAGVFYMTINASGEFLRCPHLVGKSIKCSSINRYWNEDEELCRSRKDRLCSCSYKILDYSENKGACKTNGK